MAQQTQVRRILVKVDTQGDRSLQAMAKGFSTVNKSIKETTSLVSKFGKAFLALQGLSFAGIGVQGITEFLDSTQKLGDRLAVTEGSAERASMALMSLTEVANNNRSSITDTVQVYSRLNLAVKDLGASTEATIGLTDVLQKTFRISGATAAEAAASTIQLSQGLASGQLRGQELRSVLEQNVVIGELFAKSLNTSRGSLLKFAEKRGGISAVEVFQALASNLAEVNSQAERLKPTIGEAITANFNNLRIQVAALNKEFGITEKVVSVIDFTFKNLDLAAAIGGISLAWTAYTKAVSLAAAANIAFNTSIDTGILGKILSSKAFGLIVKAGTALATLTVTATGAAVAVIALATGFVSALALSDEFRASVKGLVVDFGEFLSLSVRSNEYKKNLEEQAKAADALKTKTALLVVEQTQLEKSFAGMTKALMEGETVNLDRSLSRIKNEAVGLQAPLNDVQKALVEFAKNAKDSAKEAFNYEASLTALNNEYLKSKNVAAYNKELKSLDIRKLNIDFEGGKINLEEYNRRLQEINFGKVAGRAQQVRNEIKDLNTLFGQGGDIRSYAILLDEVNLGRLAADFAEGRKNLLDFNEALAQSKIESLRREFEMGAMTFQQLDNAIRGIELDKLNDQFKAGTIDVKEYNEQLIQVSEKFQPNAAFFVGTQNYIKQSGTLSQNIANSITNTFSTLETTFIDFTRTGKFAFRDFAASVIDDLNRIIIRSLVIRPLAQGIIGGISSGFGGQSTAGQTDLATGSTSNLAANGAYFNNRSATFFANGGVVDRPTPFSFGRGQLGVMGEAGPEAILPLKRSSGGELGVRVDKSSAPTVTVNVINQSGNEVQQRETTNSKGDKVLEVLILGTVKKGFADGAFDKQLNQQYNIRRKGA